MLIEPSSSFDYTKYERVTEVTTQAWGVYWKGGAVNLRWSHCMIEC